MCSVIRILGKLLAVLAFLTGSPAFASGDWCEPGSACETYRSIGEIYSNPEHPWVQEFTLRGRFQFQSAIVDGTSDTGETIDFRRNEVRRFYIGGRLRAFGALTIGGQANIFRDTVDDDRKFEFVYMWDLNARLDANDAFGWSFADEFSIGYGAAEVKVSEEWNLSSTAIKTIERSSMANNKAWPSNQVSGNPTGLFVNWKSGSLSSTTGIFSTTTDKVLAGWNDGVLYHLNFQYDFSSRSGVDVSELLWGIFYQDVEIGDEALADGVEWVTSLATRYGQGPWVLRLEGLMGSNGDTNETGELQAPDRRGSFWGVNVMPSIWLYRDIFEGVFRYQFQSASRPEGIGVNGRYVRAPNSGEANLPFPTRGDRHHSVYAGVNVYIWGDNLKIMLSMQYDDVTSRGDSVIDGWTYGAAFRTFF